MLSTNLGKITEEELFTENGVVGMITKTFVDGPPRGISNIFDPSFNKARENPLNNQFGLIEKKEKISVRGPFKKEVDLSL